MAKCPYCKEVSQISETPIGMPQNSLTLISYSCGHAIGVVDKNISIKLTEITSLLTDIRTQLKLLNQGKNSR